MGLSYSGCVNLNNWRHLFNPNSASAQAGALACFDHWNRTAPNASGIIETTRSGLDDARAGGGNCGTIECNEWAKTTEVTPNIAVFDPSGKRMMLQSNPEGNPDNGMPDSNARKLIVAAVVVVILAYAFKNL